MPAGRHGAGGMDRPGKVRAMKTAQEWLEDMKARPCVTENDLLLIIKAIQDDAKNYGKRPTWEWLNQALNEGDGTYKP